MNNTIFKHPLSIEEAIEASKELPSLPYNPDPVFSKNSWTNPVKLFEPVQAFDHVYWIGSDHVGSVVIDSGEGYILIDDGASEVEAAHMAESMRQFNLNPEDIKMIVISHEHFDHYGGTSYFLKNICPDAKIAISRIGWNLLQTTPTEFAFIEPRPERADILLSDGMCIKLGNTNMLCILTPGHSDGCMSFIFNASYHNQPIMVGMMGGSAAWPNMSQLRMYQSSIEYFKMFTDQAKCNAFIGAHQKLDVLEAVKKSWNENTNNPWICTSEEFDSIYLDKFRGHALNSLQCKGLQEYMMPPSPVDGIAGAEGSPIVERIK